MSFPTLSREPGNENEDHELGSRVAVTQEWTLWPLVQQNTWPAVGEAASAADLASTPSLRVLSRKVRVMLSNWHVRDQEEG